MKVNFPFSQELKTLFALINKADELRVVGGSVRDFLIKKEICDIDLACKFKPEVTKKILEDNKIRVIETGIKHGTITALINKKLFEITTLRKDVEHDGRRAKVEFVDDYYEDAKRRDFTINAMSIDVDGNLFDYFDGFKDLKNKEVKFIGTAKNRIKEDYLRILRFFRFCCYFDGNVDEVALKESVILKENLKNLSAHRIRTELIKMFECKNETQILKILQIMKDNKIFEEILLFNDFDLGYLENLFNFSKLLSCKANILTKFAAFIYSFKEKNLEITNNLEFSNKDKKYINEIINLSKIVNLNCGKFDIFKILFDFDKDLVIDSLKLNIITNYQDNEANLDQFTKIKNLIDKTQLPKFILNGNDLKNSKIDKKEIGNKLRELRNKWIESDFNLNRKELLALI